MSGEDDVTIGEVGRAVVRIEQDIREVKSDVKAQANQFVPRTEYEARNAAVDEAFKDIKTAMQNGKAMWPAWVAAGAAVAAVIIGVIWH